VLLIIFAPIALAWKFVTAAGEKASMTRIDCSGLADSRNVKRIWLCLCGEDDGLGTPKCRVRARGVEEIEEDDEGIDRGEDKK